MGFPDRIERTVDIAHPPRQVWAALTTAEGLGAWFGNEATIDLRPGGSARMTFTGGFTVQMRAWRMMRSAAGLEESAAGCGELAAALSAARTVSAADRAIAGSTAKIFNE